jgi:hypothetical protein
VRLEPHRQLAVYVRRNQCRDHDAQEKQANDDD